MRNLATVLLAVLCIGFAVARAEPPGLETVEVRTVAEPVSTGFDGVVEAVRQTVVAAQVSGAIVALEVEAGDKVDAGQVLLRIDARAADQAVAASGAKVRAARAALDLAHKEFERQQQLSRKGYISQAALERAEAQYKATRAGLQAESAQAAAVSTQTNFHVTRAPYTGVVAQVPVEVGDMAMPGRPLLTLYEPRALRVTVSVPETAAAAAVGSAVRSPLIEIPGLPADRRRPIATQVQLLPLADPGTHTVTLRLDLPTGIDGLVPGMFARIWLPMAGEVPERIMVPATAIVRRAELTGSYVLGPSDRPILRQVRVGRTAGDEVEILSGLTPGERVVLDPRSAARLH
ncbi:MAG TPA: efflux RND transporter periplasmic adaptor subunit [Burkholderiaceae bacterium]|nr:efflux RND transporter periplasmic adaptor subunit [Burkholderiaceae bacterium]